MVVFSYNAIEGHVLWIKLGETQGSPIYPYSALITPNLSLLPKYFAVGR